MPRAGTLSKLDKERRSDVFHGDPPEQPIVSPKHNRVARIVRGVIHTAEAIVLLECYCIAREAHMVGMTIVRVRLK